MLILSRKSNEKIVIGEDISIEVLSMSKRYVRLGIEAPTNIKIYRSEAYQKFCRDKDVSKAGETTSKQYESVHDNINQDKFQGI